MSDDRKRVVVVGSRGRLGSSLAKFLEADFQVTGLGRGELDLGSVRSIDEVLEPLDYDHLFLTGALTAVDYCEAHEAEAFAVNAVGPGRIAEISARKGAHVSYISTDFVFDGTKAEPYVETDAVNPISVYGASKLEGEKLVLAACPENLVARVSWVYGRGRPAFPEWIIGKACEEEHVTLPADKIGRSTLAEDLIQWLTALVFDSENGAASGVYHLCNSEPCSWRDWGQYAIEIAREAGFPVVAREIEGVPLESVSAFVAKRPPNSAMDTGKFTARTGIRPRDWMSALREFVMQSDSFARYR